MFAEDGRSGDKPGTVDIQRLLLHVIALGAVGKQYPHSLGFGLISEYPLVNSYRTNWAAHTK